MSEPKSELTTVLLPPPVAPPHAVYDDREFLDVRAFHQKFEQLDSDTPRHLTKRKLKERVNFMLEELTEFARACGLDIDAEVYDLPLADEAPVYQNLELQLDALVDLVYVAKGTAAMMGLPWRRHWVEVQRANMAKERIVVEHRAGYQSASAQIGKPPGWVGPRGAAVLEQAGYDHSAWCVDGDAAAPIEDARCVDDADAPR